MDFTDACIDATCLNAGIHFPVDWVLLRDAARTLMKAVACIRRPGLRNRMPCELDKGTNSDNEKLFHRQSEPSEKP